ncbi:MAG: PUA domain-containing protein [Nitrososphaeraceae archaeon]
MKPLPIDPREKLINQIYMIFDVKVSDNFVKNINCEFSKKTGRIKNFFIDSILFATLRKNGGLALTIFGAEKMMMYKSFRKNCIIPKNEAISFVCEGRSLFCKHVDWCGINVQNGSDVVVVDNEYNVLAVGKSVCSHYNMKKLQYGVAVKIREGIKSRNNNK